jgi:uncharacterized protein YigA (DUF484 family)
MSSTEQAGETTPSLRSAILSNPTVILEDPQILKALVAAEDGSRGANVLDMRRVAMSKLESRLGHLETAHQNVVSAAYDSVAVTAQVHRAVLEMIVPLEFEGFLAALDGPVSDCLRLRAIRLVMESDTATPDCLLNTVDGVISLLQPGFVDGYAATRRRTAAAQIILRDVAQGSVSVYGTAAADIRSEALVRLNLGSGRADGLLVLGAENPDHFAPGQATDLLEFFSRICERLLRGWLG